MYLKLASDDPALLLRGGTVITTDGKQFVFGVFGADGYECDSLEAIFMDEASAVNYLKSIEASLESDPDAYLIYGDIAHAEVRCLEVGQRIDPLARNTVYHAAYGEGQ
jgi:hypothetical protein